MSKDSIFSLEAPHLLKGHLDHLHQVSGIAVKVILERGYKSVLGKGELQSLGFSKVQCRTPGILIPIWGVDGQKVGHTYRPDKPRINARGKEIKYENLPGSSLHLDCPPRCQGKLSDPSEPLWITEGIKKVDALASKGLCAIGLSGVWGFKGKNRLGGVTLLADWDHIALNQRKVYISFDSDVMTKPEVKLALARLTEHLGRKKAEVYQVTLPSEKGEKVGVDDFLLTHTIEDLLTLAVEAPNEPPSPTVDDMFSSTLQDIEDGKLAPKQAIAFFRNLDAPLYLRRTLISKMCTILLGRAGKFIRNPEGRFYFHEARKQLLELDGFEFGALLNELFGLNQTEPEFRFTLADLNIEAHLRGLETEVQRFAFYDRGRNLLYVDRFDGWVYRLDGQQIELVDNGVGAILFTQQPGWKRYSYIENAPSNGLLAETLVDDIPFQRDSFAPLTPDQQRVVFSLWLLSLFFGSLLPTKPILTFIGEKGSGKTTGFRRVLRLLFGPSADVTGLEREKEDAFVAAITHGYLVVFDNLDGKMAWINDRLAVAATSSLIQRRRLYTTNEVAIYQPKCFLAVTSRNPQFKRDDVVDRLILLKVDRLQTFRTETELLDRVDSQRDLLWTELLRDLNSIVASLGQVCSEPKTQFRMADWATLCWRIAELQGLGDYFDDILARLSIEQSNFLLEDDPLYLCLLIWLQNPANVGREVDSRTLYAELKQIAEWEQIDWPYPKTMSFAKRLNNVKSNLAQLLQLTVRKDNRRRTFYSFEPGMAVRDEVTR